MIYFTSDTHFNHSNIINLNNRPFNNLNHMHQTLINNWNSYITDYDEVYILGDFSYKGTTEDTMKVLKKLKGKKHLIIGNHDTYIKDDNFDKSLFEWIKDYHVLDYKERKFVLFHYPILEWHGFFSGNIHLYGHVHNCTKNPVQKERLKILGANAFNVGVDVNNFYPVSINDILNKAENV